MPSSILERVKKDRPELWISDAMEVEEWPKLADHFDEMKPVFDNATSDEMLMFIKDTLAYYFSK